MVLQLFCFQNVAFIILYKTIHFDQLFMNVFHMNNVNLQRGAETFWPLFISSRSRGKLHWNISIRSVFYRLSTDIRIKRSKSYQNIIEKCDYRVFSKHLYLSLFAVKIKSISLVLWEKHHTAFLSPLSTIYYIYIPSTYLLILIHHSLFQASNSNK